MTLQQRSMYRTGRQFPSRRPRDDKSLRYLLLEHKAQGAFKQCLWDAYMRMQKNDCVLVELTICYNNAIDATYKHNWLTPQLCPEVQQLDRVVTEAFNNYQVSMQEYDHLLELDSGHNRETHEDAEVSVMCMSDT